MVIAYEGARKIHRAAKVPVERYSRRGETPSLRSGQACLARVNEWGCARVNEWGCARVNEWGCARVNVGARPCLARVNEWGCARVNEWGCARVNEWGCARVNEWVNHDDPLMCADYCASIIARRLLRADYCASIIVCGRDRPAQSAAKGSRPYIIVCKMIDANRSTHCERHSRRGDPMWSPLRD